MLLELFDRRGVLGFCDVDLTPTRVPRNAVPCAFAAGRKIAVTEDTWIVSHSRTRSRWSREVVEGSAPASPVVSPRPEPRSRWSLAPKLTSTRRRGDRARRRTSSRAHRRRPRPRRLPAVIDRTVEEFGGLDILVNNAGGEISPPFLDTRVDHIKDAIHFNVLVPFELSRLAVPHLLERPGASILNISSQTTLVSVRGSLAHHTGKTAESQLTLSMAADLGPRIRVNALLPGPIETEALRRYWNEKDDSLRHTLADHTRHEEIGNTRRRGLGCDLPLFPGSLVGDRPPHGAHRGTIDEIKPISPDL